MGCWPICQCFDLVDTELIFYQIVHFQRLITGNGRKLIQKLVYTYANAHEVIKSFNSNPGSTKYRCSILDLRVNGD